MNALDRLDAFFNDQTILGYLCDTSTRVTYLLKNVATFDELARATQQEYERFVAKYSKNSIRVQHFLNLANSVEHSERYQTNCIHYYKQTLLHMPFRDLYGEDGNIMVTTEQPHINKGPYVYWRIAKLLKRSQEYHSAFQCINQAIKLANNVNRKNLKYQKYDSRLTHRWASTLKQKKITINAMMTDIGHSPNFDATKLHCNLVSENEKTWPQHQLPGIQEEPASRYEDHEKVIEDSSELYFDSNCYIESDSIKGRHMRALDTIQYGTYILKERALSLVHYPLAAMKKCAECHRTVDIVFVACRCCTRVLFCSRKCERAGNSEQNGVHRIECGIVDLLAQNVIAWHAFRFVSFLGIEALVRFYRNKTKQNDGQQQFSVQDYMKMNQPWRTMFHEMSREEQWRAFAIVDSFVDHQSENDDNDPYWQRWAIKIILLINLRQHYFDNIETNFDALNDFFLLVQSIKLLMQKLQLNAFGWTEMDRQDLNMSHLMGNCICLVGSFMNHSCESNTYWEICNATITVTAASEIGPNEEISISYGPNENEPFRLRQKRLAKYKFACACGSCLRNALKLPCLRCTHCDGPVFPRESIDQHDDHVIATKKCMLCGKLFLCDNYGDAMIDAICTRICLHFLCRFGFEQINKKNIGILVQSLVGILCAQCEPLKHCIFDVGAAIVGQLRQQEYANLLHDALVDMITDQDMDVKYDLFHSWNCENLFKRIMFLTKWLSLIKVMKSDTSCTLKTKIQSVWFELKKIFFAKYVNTDRLGTKNLILELLENCQI